jgi:hypothetical protein
MKNIFSISLSLSLLVLGVVFRPVASESVPTVFRYLSELESITLPNDQIISVVNVMDIVSEEKPQMRIPLQDDLFGINLYNPAPLVVAHDYLAGDHIKDLDAGDVVSLKYVDGVSVSYTVRDSFELDPYSVAYETYAMRYCIYFQTCQGQGRIVKIACQ